MITEQEKQQLKEAYKKKFVIKEPPFNRIIDYPFNACDVFDFLLEKVAAAKDKTAREIEVGVSQLCHKYPELLAAMKSVLYDFRDEAVIEIREQVAQEKEELHIEQKPFDSEKFTRLAGEIREGEVSDSIPFVHGQEGTHFACPEMLEKLGDKVGCCGCNKHVCRSGELIEK